MAAVRKALIVIGLLALTLVPITLSTPAPAGANPPTLTCPPGYSGTNCLGFIGYMEEADTSFVNWYQTSYIPWVNYEDGHGQSYPYADTTDYPTDSASVHICPPDYPGDASPSTFCFGVYGALESGAAGMTAWLTGTWYPYAAYYGYTLENGTFPISVWLQDPAQTTGFEAGYPDLAHAAFAEGINQFLGYYQWPSAYATDSNPYESGQMQKPCNAGINTFAGGDPNSNTSNSSVASVDAIAAAETQVGTGASCSGYLTGYQWDDEPAQCSVNVPAQVAAIHADDSTRATIDNMAAWVTWSYSGCTSTADAAFAAPDITSSDDYHNTDAWNNCAGGEHVATSPNADCSWLYGIQASKQVGLSGGKPTYVFVETGTDELGFSSQNGSSCNTTTNVCSNGNEYNATLPQVNADAWGSVINGANGIEWFCHGTARGQSLSDSDCLGGSGSGSNAIFSNVQYVDQSLQSFAPELTTASSGACSMQPNDDSVALSTSCSNGDLSVSTSSSTEPLMAMTKVVGGKTYLFVESDRANGSTTGTYTISGAGSETATLVYDSSDHYAGTSNAGSTFALSSGSFSNTITGDNGKGTDNYGAGANSYEVQVYSIS